MPPVDMKENESSFWKELPLSIKIIWAGSFLLGLTVLSLIIAALIKYIHS